MWRKFCFLLFLLRHKERAHQACPGVRTTQAAQQSRLADGAQALAVPVRLKQPFVPHKDSSQKAALVRPTEHLKQAGQLQC